MANFLFYKYRFEQVEEKNLFSPEEIAVTVDSLNVQLANLLRDSENLNLYETKTKNGSSYTESYINEIVRFDEGVAMVEVRNNKQKKVMPKDQNETMAVEHYPYCWIVVDTRPSAHMILVQLKKDVFYSPDMVANILVDGVSRALHLPELDWKLVIEKRLCKGTIWDVVKTRTQGGNDRVKSVGIVLTEKRANDDNEVDRAIQLILKKLAVPDGELRLASDDQTRKILDETNADVRNTVDLLIENHYRMKIGFEKSGTVEYGKNTEAVYGIKDECCLDFSNGVQQIGEYSQKSELVVWLDTLAPEGENHSYVDSVKKHGRRSKK